MQDNDMLLHYGRSKADGAPGVGTGNWRKSAAAKIGKKYDAINKSLNVRAQAYKRSGEKAKQKALEYAIKENKQKEKEQLQALAKMSFADYAMARSQDRIGALTYMQRLSKKNSSHMLGFLSRNEEHIRQDNAAVALSFMKNSGISDLTPQEAWERAVDKGANQRLVRDAVLFATFGALPFT